MNQNLESPPLLKRLATGDKSVVEECVDAYGSVIWELAKKSADSLEEAEAVVLEIFKDVWQFADRFDSGEMSETDFILLIIRRRLIKRSRKFDELII